MLRGNMRGTPTNAVAESSAKASVKATTAPKPKNGGAAGPSKKQAARTPQSAADDSAAECYRESEAQFNAFFGVVRQTPKQEAVAPVVACVKPPTVRQPAVSAAKHSAAAPTTTKQVVPTGSAAKHSAAAPTTKQVVPAVSQSPAAKHSAAAPKQVAPASTGGGGRHHQDPKTAAISGLLSREYGIPIVRLTPEEAAMVSHPGRTVERNAYFATLFGEYPLVRIVDAYACIGGDTLSFLKWAMVNGLKLQIFAVQKKEHGRSERLKTHVDSFIDATGYSNATVTCFDKQIQDVIKLLQHCGVDPAVDLMYFDPPWDLPEGYDLSTNHGSAKNPSEATMLFIDRLEREVFGPLVKVGAAPARYVCLKAPTPFVEFSVALFQASSYLSGYKLDKEIKVRNARGQIILYYHTLKFVGA